MFDFEGVSVGGFRAIDLEREREDELRRHLHSIVHDIQVSICHSIAHATHLLSLFSLLDDTVGRILDRAIVVIDTDPREFTTSEYVKFSSVHSEVFSSSVDFSRDTGLVAFVNIVMHVIGLVFTTSFSSSDDVPCDF